MEQVLDKIAQRLKEPPSEPPLNAIAMDPVIDSSPKASELDIFAAKVSFASWELRDLIEAVSIACSHSNRDAILSKARHAFDLVNRYRLDRGLEATSEPRIDGSRRRQQGPLING